MATNMMRSLTYTAPTGGDVECPPEDVYTLELVEFGDFQEKPDTFNPGWVNIQSRVEFKVVDFDYDPDEDDRDWNGAKVADFYVFFKRDAEGNEKETWKSERANSNKLLTALLGRELEEGEDIDLPELVGRRIKANVAPKESGWPKISNPIKARQRKATTKKPTGPNPYEDDDE